MDQQTDQVQMKHEDIMPTDIDQIWQREKRCINVTISARHSKLSNSKIIYYFVLTFLKTDLQKLCL